MKTLQKVCVITEGGRVVGTQLVAGPAGRHPQVTALLSAGPGQQRHEIEVEVPARFGSPDEIQAFHDFVAGKLGLKKQAKKQS
jgi:hypothetical protein